MGSSLSFSLQTAKKIRLLYDKYNNDDVFYSARQRHTELYVPLPLDCHLTGAPHYRIFRRVKLVVLKQRVADYAESVPARS
jgi:hypothetical protein